MENQRCIGFKTDANTLVTGYINLTSSVEIQTNAWIDDNLGYRHWQKNNIVGEAKYSFRTHETQLDYNVCISNTPLGGSRLHNSNVDVDLTISTGLDLFDDKIAHDLKVRPLEEIIIGLEPVMKRVVEEWDNLYISEIRLRNMNESTNTRVKYLKIFAVLMTLGLWIWQVWFLHRFFKRKKLI
jgi:p24 family protein delta-1